MVKEMYCIMVVMVVTQLYSLPRLIKLYALKGWILVYVTNINKPDLNKQNVVKLVFSGDKKAT